MEHHLWDICVYHGHTCVVENEWDMDTPAAHVHWLMLHRTDGAHGSYIVTESELLSV